MSLCSEVTVHEAYGLWININMTADWIRIGSTIFEHVSGDNIYGSRPPLVCMQNFTGMQGNANKEDWKFKMVISIINLERV